MPTRCNATAATAMAGMCHRYSVIAPALPRATTRQTRRRCAHRWIDPAATTNALDIHTHCIARTSVGGDTLDTRSAPVTTSDTS